MDNIWIKLAAAVTIGMMMFFMYPAAKQWMDKGPKAEKGDWMSAIIPLAAVFGFVLLLIALVR